MVDYRRYLQRQLKEVHNMKKKLYQKTMSIDAFWTTWERFLDIFDDLNFTVTVTNLVVSLIDLDVSLDLDLEYVLPNITDLYKNEVKNWGYQKGIYGVSCYDVSYYDPEDMYKAISLLKRVLFTKMLDYVSGKSEVPAFSKGLNIIEGYTFDKACRVVEVLYAILNWTICGFVICGYSRLGPAVNINGRWMGLLVYNTADLRVSLTPYASAFELAFATHAGRTVCGFGRAVPRQKQYYVEYVAKKVWKEFQDSLIQYIRAQRDRFLFNLSGQKLLSNVPFEQDSKVLSYGNKMLILTNLEFQVKQLLRNKVSDPMTLRNYVNFVKELIFGRAKKHTYFRKGWNYVEEQKYITYLKEKYTKFGLDPNILDMLISRFISFARAYWNISKIY